MNTMLAVTQSRRRPTPSFSWAEWQTLQVLRLRYVAGRDLFNADEVARLRFVRWLYRTGRLAS